MERAVENYICENQPKTPRAKIVKTIEESWKKTETEECLVVSSEHESPTVKKNHARIDDLSRQLKNVQNNVLLEKERLNYLLVELKRAKDALRKNVIRFKNNR